MRRRIVASRAAARRAIDEGRVQVGGVPEPKAATLVAADTAVSLTGPPARFVGRGGEKLAAALDRWNVAVAGRRVIDVGASTGGFTDCLLQRGAASVVAVDVGYGQLHWKLRTDRRVTVRERVNVRHADPADLGAPFDLVVCDVSFISLRLLAPVLTALGGPGSDWILLVKPQFELGRELVPSGGVVRSPELRRAAVAGAVDACAAEGLGLVAVTPAGLPGAHGNQEYLTWFRSAPAVAGAPEIDTAVAG